jgi:hypothetical protein
MKIEVTDKLTGKKMAVDTKLIRLLEASDSGGSHIVFDKDMGRAVVEEYEDLKPFFDVIPVSSIGLKTASKLKKKTDG